MGEESIVGDFEEVVGEERLELRESQIQMIRKQEMGGWKKVLISLVLMGGIDFGPAPGKT